jgi:hypothetical protein
MSAGSAENAAPAPFVKRTKHRLSRQVRFLTLDSLDRRTNAARNVERLINGIQADLGKDMSTGQAELAKRAALLSALAEHCEVLWLRGQPIVIGDYTAVCNTLRRTLSALFPNSLERQPREINAVGDVVDADQVFLAELRDVLANEPAEPAVEGYAPAGEAVQDEPAQDEAAS